MNEDIIYLKEVLQDFKKYPYQEAVDMKKYKDILQLQNNAEYNNKIFADSPYITPVFEFDPPAELFAYYLTLYGSVKFNNRPGKNIRIIVKDANTNKYCGMIQMSSPVLTMSRRDDYIKNIHECMDITICIPFQPFGFNFNGGKLIAMLCFSKEIFEYYREKYKTELKQIYTTSLYGKSIMYDRLKCFKYVGNTEGYGVIHIPDELLEFCYELNKKYKIVYVTKKNNLHFLTYLCKKLGVVDITHHKHSKGVYIGRHGDTGTRAIEIYKEWLSRYALPREAHLKRTSRFKTGPIEDFIYKPETFRHQQLYKFPDKSPTSFFKKVLQYKNTDKSYEELSRLLQEKEHLKLSPSYIYSIFQGKVRPKTEDQEYLDLLEQEKPRKRAPKYSQEEMQFIQKHSNKPEEEIQTKFYAKFKKEMPISTIKTMKKTYQSQEDLKKSIPDISEETTQSHPDTHIMHIMRMKKDPCTLQEIRKKLRETHNIRIGTVLLNKIWNGEYKQIDTPEFQELLKYQRKKRYYQNKSEDTKKKMSESIKQAVAFRKILTDSEEEEIAEALKDNTRFPTQASVCKYFTEKFGKPVKRHLVYAIQKKL